MEEEQGQEREQERETGWFASPRRRALAVAALLLLMFALVLTASLRDTPTFDEPIYITAGYQYLRGGDFTLNLEHPPLIKEILALPLSIKELNFSQPPIGNFQVQNRYAQDFLYHMGNPPDTMLEVSRLPAYLMLVALGLLIYAWGKRVFGYRAALVSLFFFVLTPVFLGDGRLSILDLGATLFVTAALYSFYLLLQDFSRRRFLVCAFLLAAALLSRFNMFVLLALLPLLALLRPFFVRGKEGSRRRECLVWLGRSLGLLLVALLIVLVFYGVHTADLTPQQRETNIRVNLKQDSPFTETLLRIDRVSPPLAFYLLGIAHDYDYMQANRVSYWNGYFSRQWRWYYYPVIFLLKTPLALVFLFLAGLALSLRRFRKWGSSYILVCLAVLALVSEVSKIQLGIRYIMYLFPLVILLAGRAGAELARRPEPGKSRRPRLVLLGVLMLYAAVSVLLFFPSFLSYSSELIVNKDNAYKQLIDSNLDWGQDLRRLADYVERNGIGDLQIDYFGGGDPLYYLPPGTTEWYPEMGGRPHGWFALSYTRRQLGFWEPGSEITPVLPSAYSNWIEDFQPVARIGDSILLYHLP